MKLTEKRLKEIIIEELQREEKLNESWATEKVPYSSKEAKSIMDNS